MSMTALVNSVQALKINKDEGGAYLQNGDGARVSKSFTEITEFGPDTRKLFGVLSEGALSGRIDILRADANGFFNPTGTSFTDLTFQDDIKRFVATMGQLGDEVYILNRDVSDGTKFYSGTTLKGAPDGLSSVLVSRGLVVSSTMARRGS